METVIASAFSNPVRVKLLCCLSRGNKNVSELIENCGLAQSAVSQHLEKLKTAKLVRSEKRGKYIYYSLTSSKIAKIANEFNNLCQEVN